ncbi:MAG TPA: hypothetical protein VGL13_01375 [Polyangiaceae bacterium]
MKSRAGAAVAVALLYVACGGDQGDRPTASASGLPATCGPILPLSTDPDPGSGPIDCHALDGYELSTNPIDPNDVPLWRGETFESAAGSSWYTNNDRTALQVPRPDTDPSLADPIPGGRCIGVTGQESRYAMHVVTGVLTDYGGTLGRNMPRTAITTLPCPYTSPGADPSGGGCPTRQNYPAAYGPCSIGLTPNTSQGGGCVKGIDASEWDGIVLWARKAQGSQSTVRLTLGDFNDDDSNQACQCNNLRPIDPTLPIGPGNPLISATDQNDTSNGCDKFGLFATFDGTWRPYFFPFDQMQQGGWGKPQLGILTSNLFSLSISYGRGAWDFWIDDVSFYRRRK